MRQLLATSLITAGLLIPACTGAQTAGPDDDTFDPDSKADGTTSPLPFYSAVHGKAIKIAGFDAMTYDTSNALSTQGINVLDGNSSYGCFTGVAAKLAPADLQQLLADDAKVSILAGSMMDGEDTPHDDGMTIYKVARKDLFTDVYKVDAVSSLADWPVESRTKFKTALRITVGSMLSSSTARSWHFTWAQDWTDDSWLSADPQTGIVKLITHGGDC